MRIALLVLIISFNSFAEIFPSKLERLSKRFFSRKLELKTSKTSVIVSKEDNICLRRQIEWWLGEYKKMDSSEREAVKSFFINFEQININPAVLTGQVSRTLYNLRFERCYDSSMGDVVGMGNPFRDCDIYLKRIGSDPEVLTGTIPTTQVLMVNKKFNFTMQYLIQNTKTVNLYAHQARVYNEVNSMDSEAFKQYVKEGRITRLDDSYERVGACDLKSLKQFQ